MERLGSRSTLAEQPGQNHSHGDHDGGGPEQSGTEQVAKHAEQHARHSHHPCLAWGRHAPNDHQQPQHGGRKPRPPCPHGPRERGGRCRPVCLLLGGCLPTIRTSAPSPNRYKSFCAPNSLRHQGPARRPQQHQPLPKQTRSRDGLCGLLLGCFQGPGHPSSEPLQPGRRDGVGPPGESYVDRGEVTSLSSHSSASTIRSWEICSMPRSWATSGARGTTSRTVVSLPCVLLAARSRAQASRLRLIL